MATAAEFTIVFLFFRAPFINLETNFQQCFSWFFTIFSFCMITITAWILECALLTMSRDVPSQLSSLIEVTYAYTRLCLLLFPYSLCGRGEKVGKRFINYVTQIFCFSLLPCSFELVPGIRDNSDLNCSLSLQWRNQQIHPTSRRNINICTTYAPDMCGYELQPTWGFWNGCCIGPKCWKKILRCSKIDMRQAQQSSNFSIGPIRPWWNIGGISALSCPWLISILEDR